MDADFQIYDLLIYKSHKTAKKSQLEKAQTAKKSQ
jgi:hypothetical protein